MEKSLFEQKIAQYNKKERLFTTGNRILITVSGGADSVALLLTLQALGYSCIACHCNFHLRGEESNRDEQFVRDLAERLHIKCEFTDFDVVPYCRNQKVSVEGACRELRYDWFELLRQKHGCQVIAVAHHADDCIETFFLNLFRGSGITGLTSIKSKNGFIARPLLCIRRAEIEEYLSSVNQDYITDSTNLESEYSRNKVRNLILPQIRACFPNAENNIIKSIANLNDDYSYYKEGVATLTDNLYCINKGVLTIDIAKLKATPEPESILRHIINDYPFNFEQRRNMLATQTNGAIFYADKFVAVVDRGKILITEIRSDETFSFTLKETLLPLGLTIELVDKNTEFQFENNKNIAYFDAEILDKTLTLRHWQEGDKFAPFGMKGTKKVSDFFTDSKISIIDKQRIWLLTDSEEIIWIAGHRATRNYMVTKATKQIVILRWDEDCETDCKV